MEYVQSVTVPLFLITLNKLADNADLGPSKITSYAYASEHLLHIPKKVQGRTRWFKDRHLCYQILQTFSQTYLGIKIF